MIHIIDIPVSAKTHWGDVITKDIVLPAKIHHIRGIMGNVLIDTNTYFERLYTSQQENNTMVYYVENPISVQVGTFSLSINNSIIIGSDIALCAVNELRKSGYKHNLVKTDNIAIDSGSMARIEIEETLLSPFIQEGYFDNFTSTTKTKIIQAYFGTDEIPTLTNGYTVKIYIDYD